MSLHHGPEVWILVVICLALLGNLLFTWRLWRLERAIEVARTHVELLPQLITDRSSHDQRPLLRVTNAAPVMVTVDDVEIIVEQADGGNSARDRFEGGVVNVAPYSSVLIDVAEALKPLCLEVGAERGDTPVRFKAIVHHTAYGKRSASLSLSYPGVVSNGVLLWDESGLMCTPIPVALPWEGTGVIS
jgi:hypothetical protein